MRLNPLASILEKRLFKRAKSKENKKGEAGRVKPMIYLPPGNCRNVRSLLKRGSLWSTTCAFLEWSLMIHLGFWGLCFCLVVFCFSLSQKTTIIFGQCFCLFLFWGFSDTSSPKSAKNIESKFFFMSVFGWFFLFVFKIKHRTKSKETN